MKKKLISILLCMAMLITGAAFTGCEDSNSNSESETTGGEGVVDKGERSSKTLTLWVPTKEGTTEEALYAVEEAINNITQTEYDTAIKLYAVPDGEYEETVKARIKLIEERSKAEEQAAIDRRRQEIEAAKKGESLVEGTTEYVNPNMDGDLSLVVRGATGYTNVERNQMDIFLIRGADDFKYYVDNMYVQSLNEDVKGSCKVINEYIIPAFLQAATVDGSVYGIPNNHVVGEFTYFLVNKRIAEAEYLDPAQLTSLSECQEFIKNVADYHKDVVPVYGDFSPSYYKFFSSKDQDTFSVLASRVTPDVGLADVSLSNIFDYSNYTNNFYLYKKLKEQGYVSTGDVKEFGVGYITCTQSEIQKYKDDYYVHVYKRPEGKKEDYLQSVFAVSSFSKEVSRSMEIITMLNTDTELRTILQYGAVNTHWKYDEENPDIIVKLSDDYQMNLIDTGNEFVTYPDYGVSMDYWKENAHEQNTASYLPVTFPFDSYKNEDNAALLTEIDALSSSIWNEMQSMSADDFRNNVSIFKTRVSENDAFRKLTYIPSNEDARLGRTEEKGWKANGSITYLWSEYVKPLISND